MRVAGSTSQRGCGSRLLSRLLFRQRGSGVAFLSVSCTFWPTTVLSIGNLKAQNRSCSTTFASFHVSPFVDISNGLPYGTLCCFVDDPCLPPGPAPRSSTFQSSRSRTHFKQSASTAAKTFSANGVAWNNFRRLPRSHASSRTNDSPLSQNAILIRAYLTVPDRISYIKLRVSACIKRDQYFESSLRPITTRIAKNARCRTRHRRYWPRRESHRIRYRERAPRLALWKAARREVDLCQLSRCRPEVLPQPE